MSFRIIDASTLLRKAVASEHWRSLDGSITSGESEADFQADKEKTVPDKRGSLLLPAGTDSISNLQLAVATLDKIQDQLRDAICDTRARVSDVIVPVTLDENHQL
jgi:hypothetical protein